MPKGPSYRNANAARHNERMGEGPPWWIKCSLVSPDAIRASYSVAQVRERGGLTYDERQALKAKVAEIQRAKHKRELTLDSRNLRRERKSSAA